jgi:uncharacterized protein YbjT (DUF2867 family)
MSKKPILVTGASGTVGRELVRLLAEAGAEVRAGVHRGAGGAAVTGALPEGVSAVELDFEAPATLAAACRGVGAVYLLTPQVPRATEYVRAAVAAARAEGVDRVVRQSMHDAPRGRDTLSRWHREAEEIVASSGLGFTILRPNAFMDNFATIYARLIRERGSFRLPLGQARLSSVDARDVAAAAKAVLLAGGAHDGAAYILTGPEALTGAEMAAIVTEVVGRPVTYVDEPEDAGRPPRDPDGIAASDALVELSAEMRAGRLAAVSGDVASLTGRPPASFARFARDHRAAWC